MLFSRDDLASQLRSRQEASCRAVEDISKEQFLLSRDAQIVEHVVANSSVVPLSMAINEVNMSPPAETKMDVSRHSGRYFSPGQSGPFYVPAIQVDIYIPVSGDAWLFEYRPSRYYHSELNATLEPHRVHISIIQAQDSVDSDSLDAEYRRHLGFLQDYVGWSGTQVAEYNRTLPEIVMSAVADRRRRLRKFASVVDKLEIPIMERPGAPSMSPIRLEVQKPPTLPVPPKTGLKPEPGITDKIYEYILRCIRHQGRTFERTPSTFSVHDEPELRDIVLAMLNAYFEGDAVGEVFRARGKTDICIELDNRAAFVAECKIWNGRAALASAFDQLLGYLTWRDSKASLIFFNTKNTKFSTIIERVPNAMENHSLFVRHLPCSESGEWRVEMCSSEDEGRRVVVHVFLFNLFPPTS